MDENYESTNINEAWLKNIYGQLNSIQSMERISREGCNDLMEYLQIPMEMKRIVIQDAQYKNMRFMALELNLLIKNLTPILKGGEKKFEERLKKILDNIDKRNLFLKDKVINGQLVKVEALPLLDIFIRFLNDIHGEIIKSIGHILYIEEGNRKKGW